MNVNWVGLIKIAATVIKFGASFAMDWVKEKQVNETIEKKVIEVLANQIKKKD